MRVIKCLLAVRANFHGHVLSRPVNGYTVIYVQIRISDRRLPTLQEGGPPHHTLNLCGDTCTKEYTVLQTALNITEDPVIATLSVATLNMKTVSSSLRQSYMIFIDISKTGLMPYIVYLNCTYRGSHLNDTNVFIYCGY